MRHLAENNFPAIRWLRTPDGPELAQFRPDDEPNKRQMNIYYTTLLKAVIELCARYRSEGVLVVEDTCLLRPDVGYTQVAR